MTPVQRKQITPNALNPKFTGTAAVPVLSVLSATTLAFNVTPLVTGDVLNPGDVIQVVPNVNLPSGINIAYARCDSINHVVIGVNALIALTTSTSVTWTVAAIR